MAEKRNFTRLEKMIPVSFKVVIQSFANQSVPSSVLYTKNISGGGMLLLASKPIEKGIKLEMKITMDDPKKTVIEAMGIVLESVEKSSDGKVSYEIKLKFKEIDEADVDKLTAYILKEQSKKSIMEKKNKK